jgi:hypothetical protein
MEDIKKVSSYVVVACNILLVIIPLGLFAFWFLNSAEFLHAYLKNGVEGSGLQLIHQYVGPNIILEGSASDLWFVQRFAGLGSGIVGCVALYASVLCLRKIFINYVNTQFFTVENAEYYRRIGTLLLFDALIAKPVSGMMFVAAATISNSVGNRILQISFGSPNLQALFCGVVVIIVSWVMREAAGLKDDQDHTI